MFWNVLRQNDFLKKPTTQQGPLCQCEGQRHSRTTAKPSHPCCSHLSPALAAEASIKVFFLTGLVQSDSLSCNWDYAAHARRMCFWTTTATKMVMKEQRIIRSCRLSVKPAFKCQTGGSARLSVPSVLLWKSRSQKSHLWWSWHRQRSSPSVLSDGL